MVILQSFYLVARCYNNPSQASLYATGMDKGFETSLIRHWDK